jgi:hypothetical protein
MGLCKLKIFIKMLTILPLMFCFVATEAAVQQVSFTMSAGTGESATGFITYDDTVVANGTAISGGGNCSGADNSIDYQINITGGAIGSVTFNKANCSTPPAFCNVPDFLVDVNFFNCTSGGVSGHGSAPNTFTVDDGANSADLVFQSISTPAPPNAAPTASSVSASGNTEVGQQLSGTYTYADAESNPEGTSTFRWIRNSVNSGISGGTDVATTQNHTLISADLNNYLYFCVTPVATAGTLSGTEVCSTATAQISATNSGSITPPPTGGGIGEPITFTTTAKDSGDNPVNASLTVTSVNTPPDVESVLGPIKIESTSGIDGYSIEVVFKLATDSTSTYTGFRKYGPQTFGGADEWYDYGTRTANGGDTGYEISPDGKTLTVYLTDNKRGDDKLDGVDGAIIDDALLVVKAAAVAGATPIPTLSIWGLLLLTSLLGIFGFKARNKK